jgi:hypothetical protein
MSYQPGDRFTQPIQATGPGGSRTSLTPPPTLPSCGAYGYPELLPFAGQGMEGGNLQYQAALLAEVLWLQQQIPPQQYPQYQGQAIDNIGQQASSELPYNPIPQYRQPAAVEALSNQFSLQQCYAPIEPASSAPTARISFVTLQDEPMPQTPAGLSSLQRPYNVEMDYSSMGPANTREERQIMPSLDDMDEAYNRHLDEAYNRYLQQLKTAFEAISDGRLAQASVKIMDLSRWLLTNITKLGKL